MKVIVDKLSFLMDSNTNSFTFNAAGARVTKNAGGTMTTFVHAGADPVSPVLSEKVGLSTTAQYLPGISEVRSSASTYYHSGIKSTFAQTASNESVNASKRYDAFGAELASSGTWNGPFTYGGPFGYQKDSQSGLELLGNRYYDSELGRFLTRDVAKDGRNWYRYCSNNPLAYVDPEGKQATNLNDWDPMKWDWSLGKLVLDFLKWLDGGEEKKDRDGYTVRVGGLSTVLLHRDYAFTMFGTTWLNDKDMFELYNDPDSKYWRYHEHHHIWQEQQMGTHYYLVEMLVEYSNEGFRHDDVPLEIDAENNSGRPGKYKIHPWERR